MDLCASMFLHRPTNVMIPIWYLHITGKKMNFGGLISREHNPDVTARKAAEIVPHHLSPEIYIKHCTFEILNIW